MDDACSSFEPVLGIMACSALSTFLDIEYLHVSFWNKQSRMLNVSSGMCRLISSTSVPQDSGLLGINSLRNLCVLN